MGWGWSLQHSMTHIVQSISFCEKDRDTRDRNTAPTWICMNVSRCEWVGGFYCEQFSLGSPANDLKSILEKMTHTNTLCPVIMCQHTAQRQFHPCVNCNTDLRNAKQGFGVFRRGWALNRCLPTFLEYLYALRRVALQGGVLAVPWYKQL